MRIQLAILASAWMVAGALMVLAPTPESMPVRFFTATAGIRG